MLCFWSKILVMQFMKRKRTVIVMAVGMTICVFCILVSLGHVQSDYANMQTLSDYSALTFDPGSETLERIDDLISFSTSLSPRGLNNFILICPQGNGKYIVGWKGEGIGKWFAPGTGRFFTQEEQEEGAHVAYVSSCILKRLEDPTKIEVDGELYSIIGDTWLTMATFLVPASQQSNIQLYQDGDESVPILDRYEYIILPYKVFLEKYQPVQIYIHFFEGSVSSMKRYQKKLQQQFPDSAVYLPDANINDYLNSISLEYSIWSMIFVTAALLTLFQNISWWIKLCREDISVFYENGLTREKCCRSILIQIVAFFVIGFICALLLYLITSPFLEKIYIQGMPSGTWMIGLSFALLAVILLISDLLIHAEFRSIWRKSS